MDFEQFKSLAQSYTAVPVYRTLLADTVTPVSLFLKLREGSRFPFLLESVEGGEQLARYSFLGCNPYQVLTYQNERLLLQRDGRQEPLSGNYYDVLKQLTGLHHEPSLPGIPRLTGGAVGYSAYDTVRLIEHLPDIPDDDLNLPDAIWAFYDEIFAFDHVKHRIILIKTVFTGAKENGKKPDIENLYTEANKALDNMELSTGKAVRSELPFSITDPEPQSNTGREEFYEKVIRAKQYIREGDIFQVVLSQRFNSRFEGDRFMLYRALRMVNPSPYLFYLDFDDFALVGSSPEVLVRVQDGEAQVLPIAGTRPRGATPDEDQAYEEDLKNDPKEVAEHIMLVDLGRNDLSRICEAGSVRLSRNQAIERYSHVMHIVSDVKGKLSQDKHPVEALVHCFPAGTVSGAPKVRAMEIIDELENTKRGPYAGAVGYIDFSGNMDTCIAIRTMVATNDTVYIQAGAGIVADSVPEKEFEETVNKARALVEALNMAISVRP